METFLDITNYETQVFIAFGMTELFTAEELEQLQFNSIIIPNTRDINDTFEIFFDRIFQSNNRFQLVDIITNLNNRPERCIDIRIYKANQVEVIIKCDFNKKFPIYISSIVCLAINYIKYGVKVNKTYNMSKLAENFSAIAAELSSQKNSIENCNSFIKYLSSVNDNDDIFVSYHFIKQFNKGNCSYTLSLYSPEMLKLTLYNIDKFKTEYIFVPRNKIGTTILLDIFNRIINCYNK